MFVSNLDRGHDGTGHPRGQPPQAHLMGVGEHTESDADDDIRHGNKHHRTDHERADTSALRLLGGADLDDPQEYSRAVVATNRVKQLTRDSEPRAVGRSELRPH